MVASHNTFTYMKSSMFDYVEYIESKTLKEK